MKQLQQQIFMCGSEITMIYYTYLGAIHKGRPHPRGEGGLVKSGHMRTQGGGGSVAKSGRPQIQIFTKILEV